MPSPRRSKQTADPPRRQQARKPASRPARARRPPARLTAGDIVLPRELAERFDQETRDLVLARLPEGATAGDFARLLAEAARLGADPIRGDVFLKLDSSRDGADREFAVVARLDALLAYAERHPGYRGHAEAAIFADDEFQLGDVDGEGRTLRERAGVRHLTGMPGRSGDLVGAWCAVEVEGREPVVRIINADDFVGTAEERASLDPDDPRRRHPDFCAIAAAMSNAIRRAFQLNDLVGADEIHGTLTPGQASSATASSPTDRLGSPLDEIDREVVAMYHAAHERGIGATWPAAKVRALLLGAQSDDERRELAAAIREDVARPMVARLAELDHFDTDGLDEDEQAAYDAELADVRGWLERLGVDVPAAA